ncbi:hypothetical protein [Pendulispora albinea]|uniref:Uncharacterized protein n=1 Tax=Pendulispora albinea TaxID=2741071 RepID=A0ABZ2MCZ0_9BACT
MGAGKLTATVAAIGSLMATVSIAWQTEAMAPGGEVLGALLVMFAVGAVVFAPGWGIWAWIACGAAVVYEPWVGAAAVAACAAGNGVAWFYRAGKGSRRLGSLGLGLPGRLVLVAGVAAVFAPLAAAMLRRGRTPFWVGGAWSWWGERGAEVRPAVFAYEQLGWLALVLAGAGLVLALFSRAARPLVAALVAVGAMAAGALELGVKAGPTRYAAVTLAGVVVLAALAAVTMQALVRMVSAARLPGASVSAAMIVLLEVAFPVVMLDETSMRCEERARAARMPRHEALFGELPARTVLLAPDDRFATHLVALRVGGLLRPDLAIVSVGSVGARPATRELAREPKLAPFFRDMALAGVPSEWGLTVLATERPLALVFQPNWDRTVARHLVARGPFDLFHPEPRSNLERKRALEAFLPARIELGKAMANPDNPDLRALTAVPLRARAIAIAAAHDRDLVARADEDLHAFAPADPPTAYTASK